MRYHAPVKRTCANSEAASAATALVEGLQDRFRARLEALAARLEPEHPRFESIEWLRDEGRHGGGHRYVQPYGPVFNRAAINVSHVHYDDDPGRKLGSASALSTIIHPRHPHAPSVHIHISWTERKDGSGYWRLMADLNPAIPAVEQTERFEAAMREAAGEHYAEGREQGEAYFFIPALQRHRGVTHFYLEGHASDDAKADFAFAKRFGEAVIDRYVEILDDALREPKPASEADHAAQLAYHSVYLFQVLTLDRGTTSGILVHDQNDVGIMGSLPSFVDRELLASWADKVPEAQRELVSGIVGALPEASPCPVENDTRAALAPVLRNFYQGYPERLEFQARGKILPPTLSNHLKT